MTDLKLLTSDYYKWDNRGCTVTDPETGTEKVLRYFKGVTKLLTHGELSFEQKLISQLGYEKAQIKLTEIRSRGNKAHKKLETDRSSLIAPELLAGLGEHIGSEVLVYGQLLGLNTLGFIDAVYRNPDGTLSLIDYKTKKNKSSFEYYNPEAAVESYYRQLVTYSALFYSLYKQPIASVKVVMVYIDQPLNNDIFELHRKEFGPRALFLKQQVNKVLASR